MFNKFGRYYTDDKVIKGIKNGDLKIYEYLDKLFRKQIVQYVRKNSSSNPQEDGDDLYQDTILEVIRVIRDGRYNPKWKFRGFFEQVYQRRWFRILKKKHSHEEIEDWLDIRIEEDMEHEDIVLIYQRIEELGCLEIFKYEREGFKLIEIAEKLGADYGNIRKKRSRCIKKLRELFKNQ